jgi:hypothetical protein
MRIERVTRRRFVVGAMAATLPWINPGLRQGRLSFMRDAHAWVQVAALALSAISAFSRGGDGGLGAYLANIKQLSEENIRLTREVLLRVAEIQAKLAELPERMRRIFVEVQGYQLAQQTQTALNLLQAVEESYKQRGKLRDVDRRSCEQILQTCANLTGARAAAYGVGGTAASCIAVIGAVDARAHWFLGRQADFRRWVAIAYLPWFDAILGDSEFSLYRSLIDEGTLLANMGATALNGLPAAQRQAMTAQWQAIIANGPGSASQEFVLACGTYGKQTGTKRGKCIESVCDPRMVSRDLEINSALGRILEASRMAEPELAELPPPASNRLAPKATMDAAPALGDASVLARHKDFCYCGSYAADPIYTPDRASGLVGTLRSYQDENQMPQLALDRGWKAATPAHCGIAVNGGETTEAGQAAAVQRQFKSVEDALGRFDGNELASYNAQRALVFTTYKLLDATRASRNAFARAIA